MVAVDEVGWGTMGLGKPVEERGRERVGHCADRGNPCGLGALISDSIELVGTISCKVARVREQVELGQELLVVGGEGLVAGPLGAAFGSLVGLWGR